MREVGGQVIATLTYTGTPGTPVYYHNDWHGSPMAATQGGKATAKYTYGPFGEHSAAAGTPMQFTGQRYDYETPIYYLHARTYDPAQGRFFSFDPIGLTGGNNLYAYVNNDPLNLVDPLGLLSVGGVINFTLGAGEAAIRVGFGAATSWTGVGAVAGGAIALHGADVAQAAWRGTDTLTSQGLQAAGLSQSTANGIRTGITGAAYIAAGAQIIPYGSAAISGGTGGTSLLSMASRGSLGIPRIGDGSNVVLDALKSFYGTGTNAAAVGRAASAVSTGIGYAAEADAAAQTLIGEAQGANPSISGGSGSLK